MYKKNKQCPGFSPSDHYSARKHTQNNKTEHVRVMNERWSGVKNRGIL